MKQKPPVTDPVYRSHARDSAPQLPCTWSLRVYLPLIAKRLTRYRNKKFFFWGATRFESLVFNMANNLKFYHFIVRVYFVPSSSCRNRFSLPLPVLSLNCATYLLKLFVQPSSLFRVTTNCVIFFFQFTVLTCT